MLEILMGFVSFFLGIWAVLAVSIFWSILIELIVLPLFGRGNSSLSASPFWMRFLLLIFLPPLCLPFIVFCVIYFEILGHGKEKKFDLHDWKSEGF